MSVSEPVLTPPTGGESVSTPGGSSAEIKVASDATGGEYSAVVYRVVSGEEPPMHTHTREDEMVYVIDGELTAFVGDASVEVGPGAYAALPQGVPHGIRVSGESATLLLTFSPGGLERFFVPAGEQSPDPASFGLRMHDPAPSA